MVNVNMRDDQRTDAGEVTAAHRHLAHVPADVALWPQLTGAEMLELLGRTGPGLLVLASEDKSCGFPAD